MLELLPDLWRPLNPSIQMSPGGKFLVKDVHPDAAYILAFRSGQELQQLIAITPGYERIDLGQVTMEIGGSIDGFLPVGSSPVSIKCESLVVQITGFPRFIETPQDIELGAGDSFRLGGLRGEENVISIRDSEGTSIEQAHGYGLLLGLLQILGIFFRAKIEDDCRSWCCPLR